MNIYRELKQWLDDDHRDGEKLHMINAAFWYERLSAYIEDREPDYGVEEEG